MVKAKSLAWIQELQGMPVTAASLEHSVLCDYRDIQGQLDGYLVSENLIVQLMSLLLEARRLDYGHTCEI